MGSRREIGDEQALSRVGRVGAWEQVGRDRWWIEWQWERVDCLDYDGNGHFIDICARIINSSQNHIRK